MDILFNQFDRVKRTEEDKFFSLEFSKFKNSTMSSSAKFAFICGDDEFLVSDKGKAWFDNATKEITDELSKEVIDARGNNLDEVSQIVDRFIEAIQTQSMFGEKKVVWLKAVNFSEFTNRKC